MRNKSVPCLCVSNKRLNTIKRWMDKGAKEKALFELQLKYYSITLIHSSTRNVIPKWGE